MHYPTKTTDENTYNLNNNIVSILQLSLFSIITIHQVA